MKNIFTSFSACIIMLAITSVSYGQSANTSLSNLVAPTAVNQDLISNKNAKFNLGSATKGWKRLYLTNGIYHDTVRIFFADTTNVAAGTNSLTVNTGKANTATGAQALRSNGSGVFNTGIGASALLYNTSGSANTAIGGSTMYSNTNGSYNTATGFFAMGLNTTGSNNVAYGNNALYSNTSGHSNVAIGANALYKNTTASNLVAIGDSALLKNVTGINNLAVGSNALENNTSGSTNLALGLYALNGNTSGGINTAVGAQALWSNTTGTENTATGYLALNNSTYGSGNTGFGAYTLTYNFGGSYNTALGYSADVNGMYLTNSTVIGSDAAVDASNKVRIGNTSVTSIGGQVGWTTFSDGRYKKNIKENVPGLEFINALRPITYTVDINGLNSYYKIKSGKNQSEKLKQSNDVMKDSYNKASKIIHTGFIAQEVEAVANKLNYDFNGVDKPEDKNKLYGLRYDEFVVPLVKAVQELAAENSTLKKEREERQKINVDLQKQIDELKTLITHSQTLTISNQQRTLLQSAKLEQNQPNPAAQTTIIKYFVPEQVSDAVINITNANRQQVKSINLNQKNNGQITLQTNDLANGSYFYSLITDGKTVDTKKIIIKH